MVQPKNTSSALLESLCADQRRRWLQGEHTPVESYQFAYSDVLSDRESLLFFISHEIHLRRTLGMDYTLEDYVERFPQLEFDLQELFRFGATVVDLLRTTPNSGSRAEPSSKVDTKPLAETLGYLPRPGEPPPVPTRPAAAMPPASTPAAKAQPPAAQPQPSAAQPPASAIKPPTTLVPAPSPNNPVPFGDYELLERVAHGSMGIVFKARHRRLNRLVAIKTILNSHLATEDDVRRFHIEAEAAAKLEHPGIVSVYDINQHEGQHFIAMQFVQGRNLSQLINQQDIEERDAVKFMVQVAEAVQYAHEKGVVHRDLKPQNILVAADGRPRVTDFGLAKQLYEGNSPTVTGQIIGTPSYMSPEQASGASGAVSPLSDVYALGAVLFCMLAGRPPFQRKSVSDILRDVLEMPPPPLATLRPGADEELAAICHRCLAKSPGERFPSAGALARRMQRWLDTHPAITDSGNLVGHRWPKIDHPFESPSLTDQFTLRAAQSMAMVVRHFHKWTSMFQRVWVRWTGRSASAQASSHLSASQWPTLQHLPDDKPAPADSRTKLILALLAGLCLLLAAALAWQIFGRSS